MGIIAETYTDSVTITPKGTRGNDNQYAYDGTPVGTTARVVNKQGVRHRGAVAEYVFMYRVFFKSGETLALQDQVTYNSLTHRIKEIVERRDVTGTLDHYEVFCG